MYEENIGNKMVTNAKQIAVLKEEEIRNIERVCFALERSFNAEANKESHLKFRILFERAGKEWLPFIIYCLTFGTVAAASIYFISKLSGWELIVSWAGLIIVMLIPLWCAPFLHKHGDDSKPKNQGYTEQ